jgi:hypothetical protein
MHAGILWKILYKNISQGIPQNIKQSSKTANRVIRGLAEFIPDIAHIVVAEMRSYT